MDRRLPPHAKRTLQALWRAVERSEYDQRQGLPKDHARRVVGDTLGEEDESISDEEIDYHLKFLYNRGEIYYVDDRVRITTPEEIAPDSDCSANETERQDREMDTEENETG